MAQKEIRQARAKVRERERAVWENVERVGREARATDAAAARATATAKPHESAGSRRAEVHRP